MSIDYSLNLLFINSIIRYIFHKGEKMSYNQNKKEQIEKVLNIIEEKKIKFCLLQFLSMKEP